MILKEYISIRYLDLARFYGEKLGDIDRAISYQTKARSIDPENTEAYILSGIASCFRNDHAAAIAFSEQCYRLRPYDRRAIENLIVVYQVAFRSDNQEGFLQQAEKLILAMLEEDRKHTSSDAPVSQNLMSTLRLLKKNDALRGNTEM